MTALLKRLRDDAFLAELRAILLVDDRAHVGQVTHDVADLKQLLGDDEKLTQIIAPVMDRALRTSIEQNREEMIEALYPIIGQTVVRAVREAVQDLARTVDARVRTSFSPGLVFERLQARMRGVSSADLALRDALPFPRGAGFSDPPSIRTVATARIDRPGGDARQRLGQRDVDGCS